MQPAGPAPGKSPLNFGSDVEIVFAKSIWIPG